MVIAVLLTSSQAQAQRRKAKTPANAPVSAPDVSATDQPKAAPAAKTEDIHIKEPETAKAESQKLDDSKYKQTLDLLILSNFTGRYGDTPRTEIRREDESTIYYTSINFPNAVENYIEAKNGKGEFKSVLYRGDKVTATAEYDRISEIAKRNIEEEDVFFSAEKYCEHCSGLSFRDRGNTEKNKLKYWLQLVAKSNDVYDVQFIYLLTYFRDVKIAPATIKPATTPSASSVLKEEFSMALQRVLKDYPNHFETLKGIEKKSILDRAFETKYGVSIAKLTEIQVSSWRNNDGTYTTSWYCELFNGASSATKIIALYQDYISKINAVTPAYGTFTSESKTVSDEFGSGQETIWKVQNLQPGINPAYGALKIHIRFSLDATKDTWIIQIWVS